MNFQPLNHLEFSPIFHFWKHIFIRSHNLIQCLVGQFVFYCDGKENWMLWSSRNHKHFWHFKIFSLWTFNHWTMFLKHQSLIYNKKYQEVVKALNFYRQQTLKKAQKIWKWRHKSSFKIPPPRYQKIFLLLYNSFLFFCYKELCHFINPALCMIEAIALDLFVNATHSIIKHEIWCCCILCIDLTIVKNKTDNWEKIFWKARCRDPFDVLNLNDNGVEKFSDNHPFFAVFLLCPEPLLPWTIVNLLFVHNSIALRGTIIYYQC